MELYDTELSESMPSKRQFTWKSLQGIKLALIFLVALGSCNEVPQGKTPFELDIPPHFPKPPNFPDRNPSTQQGVLLGKRLFFDTKLSGNGKVSCSTCHIPDRSFTDGQTTSEAGVSHNPLLRNTPTLINLAWMQGLFWDGGAKNLESLPFAALTNPDEMGADLKVVAARLNNDPSYRSQFKRVFGIDSIASAYIARALAQYQRTILAKDSKFDRYLLGTMELSLVEKNGYEVFLSKCASCHQPPLFTDNGYHNNGLDSIFSEKDLRIRMGRFRITSDSSDIGKFKTPTLRNLQHTAPYMHDGRFETLDQVLNHYQYKVGSNLYTDKGLRELKLSNHDKEALITFLATLNDITVK